VYDFARQQKLSCNAHFWLSFSYLASVKLALVPEIKPSSFLLASVLGVTTA